MEIFIKFGDTFITLSQTLRAFLEKVLIPDSRSENHRRLGKIEGKDHDFLEKKPSHHPIYENSSEFSMNSLFSCRFNKSCMNFVIFVAMSL